MAWTCMSLLAITAVQIGRIIFRVGARLQWFSAELQVIAPFFPVAVGLSLPDEATPRPWCLARVLRHGC
jgi:hypothetical protein